MDKRHHVAGGLLLAALAALTLTRFYGHREPDEPVVRIDVAHRVVDAGEDVTLHARVAGRHTEDGADHVRWTSSIDGPLGQGRTLETALSPGRHVVRAEVEDAAGQQAAAEVPIEVR
jgi:hypothetical protein